VKPKILSVGTATPVTKFTQEEVYHLCGYDNARIKSIFMNSDIDTRHFFFDSKDFKPNETSDQLNQRYKDGSLEISGAAICRSLENLSLQADDIDFLCVVSSTGYLCPGLSSLLIERMGFRKDIQQANLLGMGCGGALPGLQRVHDYTCTHPGKYALLVCVEICSAAYYFDDTLETVVGNAICADGAAAVIVGTTQAENAPAIIDFQSRICCEHLDKVGFGHKQGKLRIILHQDIPELAGPVAKSAIQSLLDRNRLNQNDIKHWILHSGGRKVIDHLQKELGLNPDQVKQTKSILRNYGNMSSPTVLFVLNQVMQLGQPLTGDYGIMLALGPGLIVETALLQW